MLLHRIETYLRNSGMTPTRFGREAVRDPRFVGDLRSGRTVGNRVSARVSRYLQEKER